jgi:hypothetical protein
VTIEEKIKELLESHGMWADGLEYTLKAMKEDAALSDIAGRWGEPVDDYPPSFIGEIWLSVRGIALEWVDENYPQAFHRPLLAGEI